MTSLQMRRIAIAEHHSTDDSMISYLPDPMHMMQA